MHTNSFMNGDMGLGMGFGWIIGLFVLIVFIWIVIRKVNTFKDKPNVVNKSALDILNERYSRGEIDTSEYEQMKGNIQ